METTEFTVFGIRRKESSEDTKEPISLVTFLMGIARVQGLARCKIMGTESFRVVSKESPIKELK